MARRLAAAHLGRGFRVIGPYTVRGIKEPVPSSEDEMSDTRHWLMKSEPNTYSIDDLRRDGVTTWEGVRNFQARNYLRDAVKVGDMVLFYHSSAKPPGVAGLGRVVREAYPDPTAFEQGHPYFDARSDPAEPRWMMVDVGFVEQWRELVPLATLKDDPALDGLLVTRKGQRLSVMPVEPDHYVHIVALGRRGGVVG